MSNIIGDCGCDSTPRPDVNNLNCGESYYNSNDPYVDCCGAPKLIDCVKKTTNTFNYRHYVNFNDKIKLEITMQFKLCSKFKGYSRGDLVYTTTLLPLEKVRLFTSSKQTSFVLDSSSQLDTRQESNSVESEFSLNIAKAIKDFTQDSSSTTSSSSSSSSSNWNAGGNVGLDLGIVSFGGGGGGSGSSHDSSSVVDITNQLSQHTQTFTQASEMSVNASRSITVGEVRSTSHSEGSTNEKYASFSREIVNPNKAHAVNYYFYRINKCYEMTYELVSISVRLLTRNQLRSLENTPKDRGLPLSITPGSINSTSSDLYQTVSRVVATDYLLKNKDFATKQYIQMNTISQLQKEGTLNLFANVLSGTSKLFFTNNNTANTTTVSLNTTNRIVSDDSIRNFDNIQNETDISFNQRLYLLNEETKLVNGGVIYELFNSIIDPDCSPCDCTCKLKLFKKTPTSLIFKAYCEPNNNEIPVNYCCGCTIWKQNISLPTDGLTVAGQMITKPYKCIVDPDTQQISLIQSGPCNADGDLCSTYEFFNHELYSKKVDNIMKDNENNLKQATINLINIMKDKVVNNTVKNDDIAVLSSVLNGGLPLDSYPDVPVQDTPDNIIP